MDTVLSSKTVSVTELKKSFASILKEAESFPIAILNHNRPEAYLISAPNYEKLMSYIEDLEDWKLVDERKNGPFVDVNLDDL